MPPSPDRPAPRRESRYVVLEGAAVAGAEAVARDHSGALVVAVGDAASAVAAVLAAVDGHDLVIVADTTRAVVDRLCDDLRRLGRVDHLLTAPGGVAALSDGERALLAALLAGCSLGEAATRLHLSRRTADRRLAATRRALGVGSTAEALVHAAAAGLG